MQKFTAVQGFFLLDNQLEPSQKLHRECDFNSASVLLGNAITITVTGEDTTDLLGHETKHLAKCSGP
jgi:hypothetical protein